MSITTVANPFRSSFRVAPRHRLFVNSLRVAALLPGARVVFTMADGGLVCDTCARANVRLIIRNTRDMADGIASPSTPQWAFVHTLSSSACLSAGLPNRCDHCGDRCYDVN